MSLKEKVIIMKTARSAVKQDDHDASQDERNQTELGQSSMDFTQVNPAAKGVNIPLGYGP